MGSASAAAAAGAQKTLLEGKMISCRNKGTQHQRAKNNKEVK